MKHILQVIGYLGRGGDTSIVLNVMNSLSPKEYKFDFITHDQADMNVVEQLRKSGIIVHVLPGDVRKMGLFRYYLSIRKIIRNASYHYDAIHTHTSMQSGVALLAAKHENIPIRVCHSHVSAIQRKTNKITKVIISPFLKYLYLSNSTVKVGCSKVAGDYLFGKNNYVLIYNGVDTDYFQSVTNDLIEIIRKELGINERNIIIGHVAHFEDYKNQKFDIDLIQKLEGENITFVLVGKGTNFQDIQNKSKDYYPQMILLGQRNDVPVLMKLFDCVILPSLPGEGFPVTIMEAQAAGCQCIISENITNEVDLGLGLVTSIPLDKKREWIDKILSIEKNRNMSARNEYAKKMTDMGLGKDNMVKKWIDLYQ